MLELLRIKNLALIEWAEIPFLPGLNIVSGETGAGKSMVVDAIGLLLGDRGNRDLVRPGCMEAVVEGVFDLTLLPQIQRRLVAGGFLLNKDQAEEEPPQLIIKRTVHRGGRHRLTLNGELVPLAGLQRLASGLIELCGQHEHQSLLKPLVQLEALDRFGGLGDLVQRFQEHFQRWRDLRQCVFQGRASELHRRERLTLLQHQIQELRAARLQDGEDTQLQSEKLDLQAAKQRGGTLETVRAWLEDAPHSTLTQLRQCVHGLRNLDADPPLQGVRDHLHSALASAEEASIGLNRLLDQRSAAPQRLEQVQERLSQLATLKRRYAPTIALMREQLSAFERETAELEQNQLDLVQAAKDLQGLEPTVRGLSQELTQARTGVAKSLGELITRELHHLQMGDARFEVQIITLTDPQSWPLHGADIIEFLIQTNRGGSLRPLSKIASGGELSRLTLAIRRLLGEQAGIGVYLFDEIDAGMGGQTAFQVGKTLMEVARGHQVICITHLAQVAAFADHHLAVRKQQAGEATTTQVLVLDDPERTQEIARMLGGPSLTTKNFENAAELIGLTRDPLLAHPTPHILRTDAAPAG